MDTYFGKGEVSEKEIMANFLDGSVHGEAVDTGALLVTNSDNIIGGVFLKLHYEMLEGLRQSIGESTLASSFYEHILPVLQYDNKPCQCKATVIPQV